MNRLPQIPVAFINPYNPDDDTLSAEVEYARDAIESVYDANGGENAPDELAEGLELVQDCIEQQRIFSIDTEEDSGIFTDFVLLLVEHTLLAENIPLDECHVALQAAVEILSEERGDSMFFCTFLDEHIGIWLFHAGFLMANALIQEVNRRNGVDIVTLPYKNSSGHTLQ